MTPPQNVRGTEEDVCALGTALIREGLSDAAHHVDVERGGESGTAGEA